MVCLRVARSEGELQRQEVEYRLEYKVCAGWIIEFILGVHYMGTLLVIGCIQRR